MYTYDKVGNRKSYTKGATAPNTTTRYYNYAAATNRLAEIRLGSATGTLESSFSHDFEGRLATQSGARVRALSWDAKGRLRTLTQGGKTETYSYDALDYRIARSGGNLGSLSYFLEGEHLESVYAGSTLKEKYFRGSSIDELVAGFLTDTDGKLKPYLFHQDALTSNTAITGHNGG